MSPSAVENGGKSYNKKRKIFHNLWRKKFWLPNYRIIFLLFLNKFLVHKLNYIIKKVSLIQYKDFVPIYAYLISEGDEIIRACDRHWDETVTLTKHAIKYYTCGNGWSNFSANFRVVSLKLLELTQFAWPNQSIYFNFLCAAPRDDVIESTRFLMKPPVGFTNSSRNGCISEMKYTGE